MTSPRGGSGILEAETMSDDKNGLSDQDYDALLSDLEGRASEGGGVDVDDDLGDIDEFLADLDTGESSEAAPKTTATEDDDLAAEFASLEEKGELSAPAKGEITPAKAGKKEKKPAEKKGHTDDADQKAPSRAKRIGVVIAKSVLWFTPAVILWWVLGAYLGQWISAGWLIALVAATFVLAVPAVLKRRVKRGGYRPWLLGVSLVLTVALVAPIPHIAGENLTSYGHWPAAAVAEIVGADSDATFVRSAAGASGSVGTLIVPGDDPGWEARELGTAFPLGAEWSEEELEEALEELEE